MSKKSDERRRQRESDWLTRSIEQIEGSRWGGPEPGSSPLVTDCLRLRQVPVGELSLGNMRRLLLQNIGSSVIIRRIIPLLQQDPLAEADCYPGDLLSALSHALIAGWKPEHEVTIAVGSVLKQSLKALPSNGGDSGQRKLRATVLKGLAALSKVGHESGN